MRERTVVSMNGRCFLRAVLVLILSANLCGCPIKQPIKLSEIQPEFEHGAKIPLSVTILDAPEKIKELSYDYNPYLSYQVDVKPAIFYAIRDVLEKNFVKVDVAASVNSNNDLYATVAYSSSEARTEIGLPMGIESMMDVRFFLSGNNKELLDIKVSAPALTGWSYTSSSGYNMQLWRAGLVASVKKALRIFAEKLNRDASSLVALKDSKDFTGEKKVKITVSSSDVAAEAFDEGSDYIDVSLHKKAEMETDNCLKKYPLQIGRVASLSECMSNAEVNYTPLAKPFVDEFNAKRLELAKEVDAGRLNEDGFRSLLEVDLDVMQRKMHEFNVQHHLNESGPSGAKVARIAGKVFGGILLGTVVVTAAGVGGAALSKVAIPAASGVSSAGAPVYNTTTRAVCTSIGGGMAVCP